MYTFSNSLFLSLFLSTLPPRGQTQSPPFILSPVPPLIPLVGQSPPAVVGVVEVVVGGQGAVSLLSQTPPTLPP